MNHQGIEDSDLVEAYVTDRLGEQARAEFEEHFVDCPECLGRVEAAQGLSAGLRGIARETPAANAESAPARARRRGGARAPWMLAAAAVVAVLAWGLGQQQRLTQAVAEERAGRATAESRARALEEQLKSAQAARPTPLPAPPSPPAARIPILTLAAMRGSDLPQLVLPPAAQPVVLLVERESPPRFARYALTLRAANGREVLRQQLVPTSRDVLALGLDSNLLAPGVYVLTVDAETKDGSAAPVGRHRFQVVPTRE
jgi:hypothetical protein